MTPSRVRYVVLIACWLGGWAHAQPQYTVSTVAGTGAAGFEGSGGPASEATLNYPTGVAIDADGNIYIADALNRRIRRIDTEGTISTVAGNGDRGQDGDGGAATAAELSSPYDVAVGPNGNLYVADSLNSWIRRVIVGGNIDRVAGDATGFTGDGGPALEAYLNTPIGLAVDDEGNIYIADTFNNRIRKVDTEGNIDTIAGNGSENETGDGGPATDAAIFHPEDVALDSAGNLYIADTFNHRIRKISTDGTISTVAGTGTAGFNGDGGQAAQSMLNYPKSVAVDGSGRLFIADTFNSRIRVVEEDGRLYTIAGNGKFGDLGDGVIGQDTELRFPSGVAVASDGRVYFADTDNGKIKVLEPVPQTPEVSQGGAISLSAFGGFEAAAPGSWVELYGSNLASRTRTWSEADFVDGRAPTSLGGTSVTIGGREAAISYASPGQANVQVPGDLAPGVHEVVVSTAYGDSAPYMLTVNETQPGLLAPASLKAGGRQYVAAVHPNGDFVLPEGLGSGLTVRPARPGDTISLFGVGFGAVVPRVDTGEIVKETNSTVYPVQVYFGATAASVTYAGLAPGSLGLYQINVTVPAVPAGDAVPLTFTLGGEPGEQVLYTAVGE